MSDDEHAAGDTWTVAVTIPMSLPDELKDSLFHAIADAAYAWEPADRDGWDIDVVGAPIEAACDRWRRRAEQAEAYLADAIWIDPERCGGQPCIGGTRIPARLVATRATGRRCIGIELAEEYCGVIVDRLHRDQRRGDQMSLEETL